MLRVTRQKFQILLVLMIFGFVVAGCQTTPQPAPSATKVAYSTIKSSAIAYDAVMSALGDLDKQGKISTEQKSMIIKYGSKFWAAYHTSVDALIAYKKSGGDSISLESTLSTLTAALTSFLEYSSEITKGV
jgi:hypothetical protein